MWSNQNADALETLISVAAEASPRRPALAWDAISRAASVAHQTGLPEACAKVRAAMDALDALGEPLPSEEWPASRADEHRIWIRACTDPFGERAAAVRWLQRIAGGRLFDPGKVGGAAWILDETELAVRLLRAALSELRAPGVRGASGAMLSVLGGHALTAGDGTTRWPPPARPATSPPPTRWKPSPAQPTWPRPPWRPCAVTTTGSRRPVDLKVYFLRPVPPDGRDLVARGTVIHRGRSIAIGTSDVFNADGKKVAVATGSAVIPARPASHRDN
jgi:hypothetical protein